MNSKERYLTIVTVSFDNDKSAFSFKDSDVIMKLAKSGEESTQFIKNKLNMLASKNNIKDTDRRKTLLSAVNEHNNTFAPVASSVFSACGVTVQKQVTIVQLEDNGDVRVISPEVVKR